jgi:hypothetical protein
MAALSNPVSVFSENDHGGSPASERGAGSIPSRIAAGPARWRVEPPPQLHIEPDWLLIFKVNGGGLYRRRRNAFGPVLSLARLRGHGLARRYQDTAHSLGWDPQTRQLPALRHKLPEQDEAGRSVRAAVFLASQAFPLFPCFALNGKLRTAGFHPEGRDEYFAWPIWREPISLCALKSLLALPLHDLRMRGVKVVYRCRRVLTGGAEGNDQIFSNAEEWPWRE